MEAALTSYLEDTLIPELGMCETGPFAGYMDFDNRITGVSGVISSLIEDLDGDGQAELLVAVMDGHNAAQEYDELNPNNAVCLQVYEYTGSDVDLADEYLALTNVLYTGEIENDWIFLKTVGGVRYLCGSKENSSFLMADGAAYQLFLISYNGTRFLEHAQFNSIGSWLFEDPDLIAFADTLRSIGGFNASLPYMEDLPYFPTTEDYDAVLLSIHGKNEYYDRLLWNEDNWEASSALYESLRDRYNETGDISVWGLTTFEIYPNELPLSFQEE